MRIRVYNRTAVPEEKLWRDPPAEREGPSCISPCLPGRPTWVLNLYPQCISFLMLDVWRAAIRPEKKKKLEVWLCRGHLGLHCAGSEGNSLQHCSKPAAGSALLPHPQPHHLIHCYSACPGTTSPLSPSHPRVSPPVPTAGSNSGPIPEGRFPPRGGRCRERKSQQPCCVG